MVKYFLEGINSNSVYLYAHWTDDPLFKLNLLNNFCQCLKKNEGVKTHMSKRHSIPKKQMT